VPVRLVVDEALLVVEQRVEHDEARQLAWVLRRVVAADAAAKAGAEQCDKLSAGLDPYVGDRRADVAEDAGDGQVFLTPLAIAVATQVEAQRGHAGVAEPDRQAGEEAALLARDTAAVNQDRRPAGPVHREQAPGEIKTVGSSDPGLTVCHRSNDTSSL